MKAASAAGFTATAAMALTPEDVKASDSDQVTVPLDTEGNSKIQVDADWYDRYIHARDVREKISNKFFHRDGVIGVGVDPGGDGDNPHVVVALDEDNEQKNERRGEVPERKEGVRVDINEGRKSEPKCDDLERSDPLPGGAEVQVLDENYCTNGSRFINGSDHSYAFGWSVAGHCVPYCKEGHLNFPDSVTHKGKKIGEVVFVDRQMDIAYIEATEGYDPKSEVVRPNSTWESAHIHGTLSESAMADLKGVTITSWGTASCEVEGNISTLNNEIEPSNDDCVNNYSDQVMIDTDGSVERGDSGTLWFMEGAPDGNNYAVGSMSTGNGYFERPFGYWSTAAQGFSIRDKHNMWWDDL